MTPTYNQERCRNWRERRNKAPRQVEPILGKNRRTVYCVDREGQVLRFPTVKDAGKAFGVNVSGIHHCLKGIGETAAGRYWFTVEQYEIWNAYGRPNVFRDHRWRPSIHMPRACSRILLEVTNVRVERLQEIDNNDALAEGTPDIRTIENGYDMRDCFRVLWDSINKERGSWESNPWVWVVGFRRIE